MNRKVEQFRGFWVGKSIDLPGMWEWWHEDYDGPPDDRCGCAATKAGCYEQINDWLSQWEGIDEELPPAAERRSS